MPVSETNTDLRSDELRTEPSSSPISNDGARDWLIWQLADSAFPTGGFAHSGGLEAAWQQGEVRQRGELFAFAVASLDQWGHSSLPIVRTAWEAPGQLAEWDEFCDVFTTNHVANRASRSQGRALASAVERIFRQTPAVRNAGFSTLPFAHLAPVFGAALRTLEVDLTTTLRLFLFGQLRSLLAAAVRLNAAGPMEAQALQQALAPHGEAVLERCRPLGLDDVCQTAPLLDLWQGAHDRLYSRLFQS